MTQEPTAILLVNLGTPNGFDFFSVRKYLKQFLSDKRIIEIHPLLWRPILHGIILNTRPKTSGENYKRIWHHQTNQSPLLMYTSAQASKLSARLAASTNQNNKSTKIYWAMRYGDPCIATILQKIINDKFKRILLIPLFAQYSATTTASIYDEFFRNLMKLRDVPAITTVRSFATHPAYIEALADSIRAYLAQAEVEPDILIASFHGIPKSYVKKGDPYYEECCATIAALRQALNLNESKLIMSFQSRFGKEEWLQPYTDELVKHLAKNSVKKIAIFNPGFISDCLETLDEIGREIEHLFINNGGTHFAHIPCLNDSELSINMLNSLVQQNL